MLVLFLMLTVALAALIVAGLLPAARGTAEAKPSAPERSSPSPAASAPPRIAGFAPGQVIELEISGPLPAPEDFRFEQSGPDTRVLISGEAALVVADTKAEVLSPAAFALHTQEAPETETPPVADGRGR